MAVNSGYSKIISCRLGNLLTMGDWSVGSTRTAIQVKTKASEEVRYVLGMVEHPLTLTVVQGVDPADPQGVDAYAFFQQMFNDKTVETLTVDGTSKDYICDGFTKTFPLDDLATAEVSLKLSANAAGSSSSSSSSSSSGEGGTGGTGG